MPECVWITGARGFIGKHLARQLSSAGEKVFGIGHGHWPSTEANRWGVKGWLNGEVDAVNLSELLSRSNKPQTIYHLAGGSSVGVSFENPLEDFRRTVETTARLLDWIRSHLPDTKVVLASSAAVYGAGHHAEITEDSALTPYSPYGFNKAIMETLCRSNVENFGLNAIVVRLFSVYGDGLQKQLLWDLCSKLAREGTATLGGTGAEVRDWVHVRDVAYMLIRVADFANKEMPIFNGGSGIGVSVLDIAQMVCAAWGDKASVMFSGQTRIGDPASLVADIGRLSDISYRPSVSLQEGIEQYVTWFKSFTRS